MAMSVTLKVDVNIVIKKLDLFKVKKQVLKTTMERIKDIVNALSAVSWISPAARAFKKQFELLYKQVEEAFRIVDEYIHDLEVVIESYTKIEARLEESIGSLRTDIFGV